jgi:hypothetical protein
LIQVCRDGNAALTGPKQAHFIAGAGHNDLGAQAVEAAKQFIAVQ